MTKKAIETLRNGLEDSHWYSDDDEKIFNELVIKAKAFDEIMKVFENNFGAADSLAKLKVFTEVENAYIESGEPNAKK